MIAFFVYFVLNNSNNNSKIYFIIINTTPQKPLMCLNLTEPEYCFKQHTIGKKLASSTKSQHRPTIYQAKETDLFSAIHCEDNPQQIHMPL